MSALIWPLDNYTLSSGFGPRSGGFHYGDDLAAPLGTPIHASGDGTVMAAGAASGFGQWIILDHVIDGKKVSTVYGHMYPSGVHVRTGQVVTQGQHIADVGSNGESTGPHCHFEVWPGGRLTGGHAVDPATYVNGTGTGVSVQTVGGTTSGGDTSGGPSLSTLWDIVTFLIDPHNWWRAFLFLAGLAVAAYVLWSAMNNGSAQ